MEEGEKEEEKGRKEEVVEGNKSPLLLNPLLSFSFSSLFLIRTLHSDKGNKNHSSYGPGMVYIEYIERDLKERPLQLVFSFLFFSFLFF